MADPPRRTAPPPRAFALLLLMALGFGLLAAVLAGPLPPTPPGSTASNGAGSPFPTLQLIGDAVVILVGLYLGYQVYARVRGGRLGFPIQVILFLIAVLVLLTIFAVALHDFAPGGSGSGGANGSLNGTGQGRTPPTAPPGGAQNGSPLPGQSVPGLPSITWGDLGLLAVAIIAGVLVYWLYAASRSARVEIPEAPEPKAAALRAEIEQALRELDASEEGDPREVILALYRRLLLTLRPRFGSLAEFTPREIARAIVATYRVGAEPARQLTEAFEEARYSRHPLDLADARRARGALDAVLADLRAREEERERRARERMEPRTGSPTPPAP